MNIKRGGGGGGGGGGGDQCVRFPIAEIDPCK